MRRTLGLAHLLGLPAKPKARTEPPPIAALKLKRKAKPAASFNFDHLRPPPPTATERLEARGAAARAVAGYPTSDDDTSHRPESPAARATRLYNQLIAKR